MPSTSLPTIIQQTEKVLDDILSIVNRESRRLNSSLLSETERNRLVSEERSLRSRVRQTSASETSSLGSGFRSLLGLSSPQVVEAKSCLNKAEILYRGVNEDLNQKRRAGIARNNVLGLSLNSTGTMTPEADTSAVNHPGGASTTPASPNAPRSISGVSAPNDNPITQAERDYTSDLQDAINTPIGTEREPNVDTPTPNRRRPPPPTPRRAARPNSLRILSETTGSPASGSHRSSSVRRSAPPPPRSPRQPRSPLSPTVRPFSLPQSPQGPLDPAFESSMADFARQMTTFASSVAEQARASGHGHRHSVSKINCIDITGSTVDGLTMHNGGSNNTGAVIHKMVLPTQSLPQRVQPV